MALAYDLLFIRLNDHATTIPRKLGSNGKEYVK